MTKPHSLPLVRCRFPEYSPSSIATLSLSPPTFDTATLLAGGSAYERGILAVGKSNGDVELFVWGGHQGWSSWRVSPSLPLLVSLRTLSRSAGSITILLVGPISHLRLYFTSFDLESLTPFCSFFLLNRLVTCGIRLSLHHSRYRAIPTPRSLLRFCPISSSPTKRHCPIQILNYTIMIYLERRGNCFV